MDRTPVPAVPRIHALEGDHARNRVLTVGAKGGKKPVPGICESMHHRQRSSSWSASDLVAWTGQKESGRTVADAVGQLMAYIRTHVDQGIA